jgi:hypothetical protein
VDFVKVESSQIDSVGFGEGAYGPETLGIRFKQKNGISEYHYNHVTARMYQALVAAESVGKYFGANIRNRPEFPFMKVETENPTQPPSDPNGGGATLLTSTAKPPTCTDVNHAQNATVGSGASSTTNRASFNATTADTTKLPFLQEEANSDNPSTSLAIIDKLDNSALFAAGGVTDAQLAAGREWYITEAKKYDISTEAKRTELKRFARPLQKLRTGIEARAKEFTGETKRKIAAIDTEKRRLVQIVGGIEDEVLSPLTAWEQEESVRMQKLAAVVSDLCEKGQAHLYQTVASLEGAISHLESFDLSTMQEYKVGAESAISASLRVLKPELERRKQAEKDAAELEALRAAAAARAEQDRQAELKRQEDARIAAAVEAAKVEIRQEVIAEFTAPESVIPHSTVDLETQPFVYPEIPASTIRTEEYREISNLHKQAVHAEIVEFLQGCTLTRQEAILVLKALVENQVPHVSITY